MGKPVSTAQSHAAMQALACNVDWKRLDGDRVQSEIVKKSRTAGEQLTAFLEASPERRAMFAEGREFKGAEVVRINRSEPFNPERFPEIETYELGKEDKGSLAIHELDLGKVKLVKLGDGRNRRKNLKRGKRVCLDAKILETLLNHSNQHFIPEYWKKEDGGEDLIIFFDGTEMLSFGDRVYILGLQWDGSEWTLTDWLEEAREGHHLSAVIELD